MSKQCLVIGPYGSPGTDTRDWSDWVLEKIVEPVANDYGYLAERTIDKPKPGMITARIVKDLQTAELVVADLTESNPNAYYELALRHSTAKPFIHLARDGTVIPFDITGMDVISISKNKEAEAREILRQQFRRLELGDADFESVVSPERPANCAKAYTWEITYSNKLAGGWLRHQGAAIRDAVKQFEDESTPNDQQPRSQHITLALLEYLAYKASHATNTSVDLYYVVNRKNNHFEGWGTAPPAVGRAHAIPLQVSGNEEDDGRRVVLNFNQPAQHVNLGNLEGEIKAFRYTVEFRERAKNPGVFEGKFFHPECTNVLVGTCQLVSMTE